MLNCFYLDDLGLGLSELIRFVAHVGVEDAIGVLGGLINAWFTDLVRISMSRPSTSLRSSTDSLDPFFLISSELEHLPASFWAYIDPAWSRLGVDVVFQDVLRCLASKILRQVVISSVEVVIIIIQTLKLATLGDVDSLHHGDHS